MRPLRLLLPALLVALPLPGGVGALAREAGSATHTALAARIERRLAKAGLQAGRYGVVVLTRGRALRVAFARGADRPLVPASAAKLLTAAAALDLLGPSHRFVTRLTARGRVDGKGTLAGDLVLHGAADPNLSGRFFDGDPMHVPDRFAGDVARAGIRRVDGALVLDEGLLDRAYVHPDWSASDKQNAYGAPAGGLSFNDGCIDVELRGGAAGQPARVHLPATAGPWRVRNDVKTVAGAKALTGGEWIGDGRVLRLAGRLAPGARASFRVPVPDPTAFLGGALLHALRRRGIEVRGGQRRARDDADRMPGDPLAEHESELPPTLGVLNGQSQNVYASLLFKLCGAAFTGRGTWEAGGRAVRAMLERRHVADAGTTDMRDGSGLSPRNRVTAGVLANVLASFDRDILRGPVLIESLAVSGRSGTLRRRLRERGAAGRVHAKTGTLNDTRVRALAGYVDGRGRHPGYVFAILLNGRGASSAVIDDIVRELLR